MHYKTVRVDQMHEQLGRTGNFMRKLCIRSWCGYASSLAMSSISFCLGNKTERRFKLLKIDIDISIFLDILYPTVPSKNLFSILPEPPLFAALVAALFQ